VRRCGSKHPILSFKAEDVRATALLAFLEEVHITKRALIFSVELSDITAGAIEDFKEKRLSADVRTATINPDLAVRERGNSKRMDTVLGHPRTQDRVADYKG
jgi:hypothetical protein